MSEDCSIYNCLVEEDIPYKTADGSTHKAKHDWSLRFSYDGITLCDVERHFDLQTVYNTNYSADKYKYEFGSISPCNETASGTRTGYLEESISGNVALIMYADLENSVYLVKRITENITSSVSKQNPFHYFTLYSTQDSIAYFMELTKTQTITYELYKSGVIIKSVGGGTKTSTSTAQPVVWPQPSSKSMFFLAVPEYKWLEVSFFYWYNDPSDVGFAPCYYGFLTGDGVGILTGYERALKDGGKDFFYPDWIRDFAFIGVPPIHNLWATEAQARFSNILGGPINPDCAKATSSDYNIGMWISSEIIGNYIKYADTDFYSFFLPEVEKTLNNLGNQEITDTFLNAVNGATTCYPISLL